MKYLTVGPIELTATVRRALAVPPTPSRSTSFRDSMSSLRAELVRAFDAGDVHVLLGSGTLANDAVASQLRALEGYGLVLVNGEFGDRLRRHATSWALDHVVWEVPWGEPFDFETLRRHLAATAEVRGAGVSWVWAAHCETSTGMLNPIAALEALAASWKAPLCLDCVSSLGNVKTSLRGIHLASGSSGKGLAAGPGLALVFRAGAVAPPTRTTNGRPPPCRPTPRYLDLQIYDRADGLPFTQCTSLVEGLRVSLEERRDADEGYARTARLTRIARRGLERLGLPPIVDEELGCPGVLTVAIPGRVRAARVAGLLESRGLCVSAASGYLVERNWLQVGVMGSAIEASDVDELLAALGEVLPTLPVG